MERLHEHLIAVLSRVVLEKTTVEVAFGVEEFTRGGASRPAAYIVPAEQYERLKKLEQLRDALSEVQAAL